MIRQVLLGGVIVAAVLYYASSLPSGQPAPAALIGTVSAAASPASTAQAPTRAFPNVVRIDVTANETTAYSTPWDGMRMGGIVGSVMPELPTSSPPDLAVCVVALTGSRSEMDCYHEGRRAHPTSLCHDAFECSFEVTVPTEEPFGIVVVDLDAALLGEDRHDLVDAFLVAARDQDVEALANAVRAAVRMRSRTDVEVHGVVATYLGTDRIVVKPNEERRRSTGFKTFERGECEAVACRLSQSQVRIRWGR